VAKLCDDDTCNLYVVAPVAVFHLNDAVIGIPDAPSAGDESVGTVGGAAVVVKLDIVHPLGPPALIAWTLHV